MPRLADFPDVPLLVHSVSWASGVPRLVVSHLAEESGWQRTSLEFVGESLAFDVDPTGRFCTGRFVALSADDGRHEPCSGARLATTGAQCEECAARDDSRFMHLAHRGGYVPDSLARYLAQPHWLYIATFADGTSKVGTASDLRKRVRLDEQGAVRATYIAHTDEGRSIRVLEDAVTEHAGIPQTKHKSSKAAALTRILPPSELDVRQADAVHSAVTALEPYPGRRLTETWQSPTLHAQFVAYGGIHPVYSHSLQTGSHCLTPRALIGGVALVSVNDDSDVVLVDLDQLRGRRITARDDARSPESTAQHSLF